MERLKMDFSDFIAKLPDDSVDALNQICIAYEGFHSSNVGENGANWKHYYKHEYQLFYRTAQRFIIHFDIVFIYEHEITDNEDVNIYFNSFRLMVSELYMEQTFDRKYITGKDSISLTKSEIAEIQTKIDELRKTLSAADYIEAKHKRRILMRLEKFQSEIHKAISDLDIFKAGWSEVNDMLEDTGKKAKPIVDRFKEIISIAKKKDPLLIENDEVPKQIEDKSGEGE